MPVHSANFPIWGEDQQNLLACKVFDSFVFKVADKRSCSKSVYKTCHTLHTGTDNYDKDGDKKLLQDASQIKAVRFFDENNSLSW